MVALSYKVANLPHGLPRMHGYLPAATRHRHHELDGVLVVGQLGGVVVAVPLADAVPRHSSHGAFEFGQVDRGVSRLDQNDITVYVEVSGEVGEGVLDDGSGRVVWVQLGQVGDGRFRASNENFLNPSLIMLFLVAQYSRRSLAAFPP